MALKYQKDIDKYCPKDCPPQKSVSIDIEAFRLVNDPISAADFHSYINLGRLPRETDKSHVKCKHCGLSLFTSLEGAQKRVKQNPQRSKLSSTHIAGGKILKSHGLCTEIKHYHFTIHEFSKVNLVPVFTVVQPIEDWKS